MADALTRRTVEHVRFTKVLFLDAFRDRHVNDHEFELILASFEDAESVSTAADAARALGEALGRAVGSERYRKDLTEKCWTAFDELPDEAA